MKNNLLLAAFLLVLASCQRPEPEDSAIAGALATPASAIPSDPTLKGVAAGASNQLGNDNSITPLTPRRSKEITAGNLVGVALGEDILYYLSPEVKGMPWSPCWMVAESFSKLDKFNTFSSAMHLHPEAAEWAQVELKEPTELAKVALRPRDANATGFPVDFQILLSLDGKTWDKVADLKDYTPKGQAVFSFAPREAKFVRVLATKLRQEGKVYYFQLAKIEAVGTDGVNHALASEGAVATAGSPLTDQAFDYQRFYEHLFAAGVKWVIVSQSREVLRKRRTEGIPPVSAAELATLDSLRANGVEVIYRVDIDKAADELLGNPGELAEDYVSLLAPVVTALKGKVAIWVLANEENMYDIGENKAAFARHPGKTPEDWKRAYVKVVSAGSDTVRRLDPGALVEIETALFDFGWTADVLRLGLADKVDAVGVHVYKEVAGKELRPEMAATFFRDGKRGMPKDQPYADYKEEIQTYQKLLHSFNPALKMNVDETCVNIYRDAAKPGCMTVSEKSQAKCLARLYLYHQFYGVGPTCWWMLTYGPSPDSFWGLLDMGDRRRAAWYAMRNVAAVMDDSYTLCDQVKLSASPEPEHFTRAAFRNAAGEMLIPYWAAVPMRDENTGVASDLRISGDEVKSAEAVDLLSGTVQRLDFESVAGGALLKNMVVRDYPVVLRINAGK